ncbi:capsular polysaccharide biosynthesis O-acetyl transferase [Novosphingobium sp. Rr 2-17]|uniref:acyltransferase family protein n=1 Tax=Novosphingobium sp. Rr 2-17 TaxID=555793 RepID=UPI0002699EFF|nr:acyltransferase [Novosphingobium sp. Rr 2-17]EIZ78463.1 capsular polysaccharide biosynthesis O-acetyl transferase [Novosphingobium sp. Rr 2-17]
MGFIANIQVLRAVAALAVVVFHARNLTPIGSWVSFDFGNAGVDIFFVMSGFIIAHVTNRSTPLTVRSFLVRRAVRVVPLYWLLTLCVFTGGLIAPGLAGTGGVPVFADLIRSLAFVPYWNQAGAMLPVLFMGWTLNYEVFFYFAFALALPIRRGRLRLLAISLVLVALVLAGRLWHPASAPLVTYTDPLLMEFVAGMWLSQLYAAMPPRANPRPVLLSAVVALATGFAVILFKDDLWPHAPRILAWGAPAVLIVGTALALDRLGLKLSSQPLMLLGDASYSLYLTHPLVIKAVTLVYRRLDIASSGVHLVMMLAACALCIIVAVLVHLFIERPLMNALRRLLLPQPAPSKKLPLATLSR